jgi:division/cell wall cluster transcriptional repressor MraZ
MKLCSIDSTGRVLIPAQFRDAFRDQSCHLTVNPFDRCLSLYMQNKWYRIRERLGSIDRSNGFPWQLVATVLANAHENPSIDARGRLTIPAKLLHLVHELGYFDDARKCAWVGMGERLDLIGETQWQTLGERAAQDYLAESAASDDDG